LAIHKFATLIVQGKDVPLFGDGSMQRDYTYIEDIISGIVAALESNFQFEIFNLGNSHPVRLDYMVETLEKTLGRKAVRKHLASPPGEMPITYADLTKSRKLLGYQPSVGFEEGIRLFVEWFRKRR
jgi:UDP-glucuronate 4-epimerase